MMKQKQCWKKLKAALLKIGYNMHGFRVIFKCATCGEPLDIDFSKSDMNCHNGETVFFVKGCERCTDEFKKEIEEIKEDNEDLCAVIKELEQNYLENAR